MHTTKRTLSHFHHVTTNHAWWLKNLFHLLKQLQGLSTAPHVISMQSVPFDWHIGKSCNKSLICFTHLSYNAQARHHISPCKPIAFDQHIGKWCNKSPLFFTYLSNCKAQAPHHMSSPCKSLPFHWHLDKLCNEPPVCFSYLRSCKAQAHHHMSSLCKSFLFNPTPR